MCKVKDRKEWWDSRGSCDLLQQPSPKNVKAIIEPFLLEKGIKTLKTVGKGNMSSVFEGAIVSTNEKIIIKAVAVNAENKDPSHGFTLFERVAKKEERALRRLHSLGYNVPELKDVFYCPIQYARVMEQSAHKKDYIVIFIIEKLSSFAEGRSKKGTMMYSKHIKRWCKEYGKEVVAAELGRSLIEQVTKLRNIGVWHRDLKSFNVTLRVCNDDLFSSKFILIDWGYSHIIGFDEYSDGNDLHDFTPGSVGKQGGTVKYYPHHEDYNYKFDPKDEYFAVGMILADLFDFLKTDQKEVKGKIETSNLSSDMKKALLALTEYDIKLRNPDLALRIFESIVEKSKNGINEKGKTVTATESKVERNKISQVSVSSPSVTKHEEIFTLADVEKAILQGRPRDALGILDYINNNSAKSKRLKGIAHYMNSEEKKAIDAFNDAMLFDRWSGYMYGVLTSNDEEREKVFERMFFSCKEDPLIFPLVCYHINLNKDNSFTEEALKSVIQAESKKVNPAKCNFNELIKAVVKAA